MRCGGYGGDDMEVNGNGLMVVVVVVIINETRFSGDYDFEEVDADERFLSNGVVD